MRVLFLLDNYEDDDPVGAIFYRLCQRWVPTRELNLGTLAFGKDGPLKERLRSMGVGARVVPWRGWKDRKAIREEGHRCLYRSDRPDLVQSLCRWPALPARFFHSGRPDVPLLLSLHRMHFCTEGVQSESLITRLIERATRKWVSAVVTSSKAQNRELRRRKFPAENLYHVPMGVDGLQCYPISENNKRRFRSLLGVSEEAPLLVTASRIERGQGLEDIISAMKEILAKHPSARLFLVGDGSYRKALEQWIAQQGLSESVRIVGHLSAVLAKLFSTADVVIHTARREAFPLNVIEAQAAGSAVVAVASGGTPEFVRDGETGLLVPPGKPEEMAEAVNMLLGDGELRGDMGEVARDHVLEHHELSQTANRYIALWRELAPHALWQTTTSVHIEDLEDIKREAAQES